MTEDSIFFCLVVVLLIIIYPTLAHQEKIKISFSILRNHIYYKKQDSFLHEIFLYDFFSSKISEEKCNSLIFFIIYRLINGEQQLQLSLSYFELY